MDDPALELSLVIPTFNERGNIVELVRRLDETLTGISWEVVFVDDDSPDRTSSLVRELARRDRRIRCAQRIGRRGLSSACIEGMLATSAPFLAVMDADLQHDETRLPEMLKVLRTGSAELVVGTRYAGGGTVGSWDASRARMSRLATRLSRTVCKQDVSDPMSGFFMLRREVVERVVGSLSGMGFKILLDILATSHEPIRVAEVPYRFGTRFAGESKLDSNVLWEFGMLLADKLVGKYVPVRFVSFIVVGAAGLLVHMSILAVLLRLIGTSFTLGQSVATIAAMIFNFTVNNVLTYRDRRLHGWHWLRGLLTFVLACGVGAFANVGVASYLFHQRTEWFLAALAGVAVGAVWNYGVTMVYTWGQAGRKS
jgi:dolichol-phosphate mannosyltransferase